MKLRNHSLSNAGFSLIEVLVTIVILAVGLLGLAGLQARALTAESEAFSRGEALVLLQDMADRIAANRADSKLAGASAYSTNTVFGTGHGDADCSALASTVPAEVAAKDLCEWDMALKGASQTLGGAKVGGVSGARGCLALQATPIRQFVVTIAWEGRAGFGSVAADITCGSGAITESRRRAVTVTVPLPDLNA